MDKLANLIEGALKKQDVCAVYDSELARVWPPNMNPSKRKQEIKHFADQHDLAVTFYDVGLCAIFERLQPGRNGERAVELPLKLKRAAPKRKRRS
jgi:hypothetical protein